MQGENVLIATCALRQSLPCSWHFQACPAPSTSKAWRSCAHCYMCNSAKPGDHETTCEASDHSFFVARGTAFASSNSCGGTGPPGRVHGSSRSEPLKIYMFIVAVFFFFFLLLLLFRRCVWSCMYGLKPQRVPWKMYICVVMCLVFFFVVFFFVSFFVAVASVHVSGSGL